MCLLSSVSAIATCIVTRSQQKRELNTDLWPFRVSRLSQALKIHVYNRDLRAYSSYIGVDLPWNDQRQDTCAASRSISMPSALLCCPISNGLIFLSFCCFQNGPIYWKNCRVLCRIFYSTLVNIDWFTHDRISVSKDKLFPSLFLPFFSSNVPSKWVKIENNLKHVLLVYEFTLTLRLL